MTFVMLSDYKIRILITASYTLTVAIQRQLQECIMERTDDVIDLGTASIETQGAIGENPDVGLGQNLAGLTDD